MLYSYWKWRAGFYMCAGGGLQNRSASRPAPLPRTASICVLDCHSLLAIGKLLNDLGERSRHRRVYGPLLS